MSDVIEKLEVELARATRGAEEAERRRLAAMSEHQRANTAAQHANRWREALDEALDALRAANPYRGDNRE